MHTCLFAKTVPARSLKFGIRICLSFFAKDPDPEHVEARSVLKFCLKSRVGTIVLIVLQN